MQPSSSSLSVSMRSPSIVRMWPEEVRLQDLPVGAGGGIPSLGLSRLTPRSRCAPNWP